MFNDNEFGSKWLMISFFLGLVIVFESTALYALQKFQRSQIKPFYVFACLIYGLLVPYFLYRLLTYQGIGMVNFLWNIFSTIAGFVIGIYLFKEQIGNLQWIGVALGFLAFILIFIGDRQNKLKVKHSLNWFKRKNERS